MSYVWISTTTQPYLANNYTTPKRPTFGRLSEIGTLFLLLILQQTGVDVPTIMAPWSFQMGLPVVTVTEEDGNLELSQKRFLSDPEADPTEPDSEYG